MKKFILIALLFFVSQQISYAIVTDEQLRSPEGIVNSGYSTEMADMVNMQMSRDLGQEFNSIKPVKRCKRNKFTRFCRKCLEYIDPALDDDSFYSHDIEMEPKTTDF